MENILLNPNCSEAVMKINVSKVDKQLVEFLSNQLDEAIIEYNYETDIFRETMFGLDIIKIRGDMPYNDPEKLIKIIEQYTDEYEFEDI